MMSKFNVAIVAFFCADIGLDVMRDSRYAVSSGWWHLSWVVIVAIALIAKLGPALICCLPSWATRQSFGNANNNPAHNENNNAAAPNADSNNTNNMYFFWSSFFLMTPLTVLFLTVRILLLHTRSSTDR